MRSGLRRSMVTIVDDPAAGEIDALLASNRAVVVEFYATWCGPCKTYGPRFAQAARDARRRAPDAAIAFVKVDIDAHRDLARRWSVQSVPTTIVLRRKKGFLGEKIAEVARWTGAASNADLQRRFAELVD